ncbi:stage 0 sporulation protein [Candidatus Gracilibacteria bacterium CG17_big_fil_post_rev_8_21_14_2_50_48_13]|nr:MAG: stage 0 sporulation protein [Candidatus Gracilibacteria bacterium CG17_big_fil_post_rev_8_21_14_2_50_48_13]
MVLRINHLRRNSFHDIPVSPEMASSVKSGDFVLLLFSEDRRVDVGQVVFKHDYDEGDRGGPELLRAATMEDIRAIEQLRQEERAAFEYFVRRAKELELPMKPVAVFLSFDGHFGDFVFTAEERVDFRELVRDLTSTFKRRIFLEQVSSRERANLAGGCGSCGRTLCCSTFLKERPPVVMQAVRTQNMLFRDREKLTGLCGKLKCCLNYELEVYEELAKDFPALHSDVTIIATGERHTVISRSILDQQVRVVKDHSSPAVTVKLSEISFEIRSKGEVLPETLTSS